MSGNLAGTPEGPSASSTSDRARTGLCAEMLRCRRPCEDAPPAQQSVRSCVAMCSTVPGQTQIADERPEDNGSAHYGRSVVGSTGRLECVPAKTTCLVPPACPVLRSTQCCESLAALLGRGAGTKQQPELNAALDNGRRSFRKVDISVTGITSRVVERVGLVAVLRSLRFLEIEAPKPCQAN